MNKVGPLMPNGRERGQSILHSDPSEVRVVSKPPEKILEKESSKTSLITMKNSKKFSDIVKTAMLVRTWMATQSVEESDAADVNNSMVFDHPSQTSQTSIPSVPEERDEQDSLAGETPESSGMDMLKHLFVSCTESVFYFTVNPEGTAFYYWTTFVCIGIVYNMLALAIFIFDDVYNALFWPWFACNMLFDCIYLLDILVQSRTTYTHNGEVIRSIKKSFLRYKSSYRIYLDLLALLPLDVFLFILPSCSLLRTTRLFKCHRIIDFVERTVRRTSIPNAAKILLLIWCCYIIFHWNACVYFFFSLMQGIESAEPTDFVFSYKKVFDPVLPICDTVLVDADERCGFDESGRDVTQRETYINDMMIYWSNRSRLVTFSNFSKEYCMSMYWSALTITTCGQQPWPANSAQNLLEVVDTLIGLVVFATIVGSVGSVVSDMNEQRSEFQQDNDAIKFYMKSRQVNPDIQSRVLACTLYMYNNHQMTDEKRLLRVLPPRLKGQIAVNLHMDTLRKVPIFKECEPGFLYELVLRLKQTTYGPNDYLCQAGDNAHHMFIVKKGTLVIVDEKDQEQANTLTDGSTFGMLSIVRIPGVSSERHTVGVRSIGYSDIYILNQEHAMKVLVEYPEEKKKIYRVARELCIDQGLLKEGENDEGDDDDMNPYITVEQKILRMHARVKILELQINNASARFSTHTAEAKRRVASLERLYKKNRKRVRREFSLA